MLLFLLNNSYGSLEIENNEISYASVTGNVFHKKLWVDDTSNVSVVGNTVSDIISITAESNNTNNINITGNTCEAVRLEQFGSSPVGVILDINITGNSILGSSDATYGLWLGQGHGSVYASSNNIRGTFSSGPIGIVRNSGSNVRLLNNRLVGTPVISSSGGVIYEYGNTGWSLEGEPSEHISKLMQPNEDSLDLAGWNLHNSRVVNGVTNGGVSSHIFYPPDMSTSDYQKIKLDVIYRDTSNGDVGSFSLDAIRDGFNSYSLEFGNVYNQIGLSGIAVTQGGSTDSNQYQIACTNNTGGTINISVTARTGQKLSLEG